jgi:hypothetical protein
VRFVSIRYPTIGQLKEHDDRAERSRATGTSAPSPLLSDSVIPPRHDALPDA